MNVTLIHRILGESLFWLPLIGLILALVGKDADSGARRGAIIAGRVLVILLSVQWLLGVINFFSMPAATRTWAHPILMTVLLGGVHMVMSKARKEPGLSKGALAGFYAATMVLIVIGMMIA